MLDRIEGTTKGRYMERMAFPLSVKTAVPRPAIFAFVVSPKSAKSFGFVDGQ